MMEAESALEQGSGGVAAPQHMEVAMAQTEDLVAPPSVQQLLKVIAEHKKREQLQLAVISSLEARLAATRATVTEYRACHDVINNRLRTIALDPAVSLEIQTLRQKLFETETLLRRAKEQLAAQNFSGQSVMGQRLINKCKTLQEENNELGRSLAETHLQPLTLEVAGLKKHVAFLRGELRQLRELNSDMDRDNETMALQLQELSTTMATVTGERDQLQQHCATLQRQVEALQVQARREAAEPKQSHPRVRDNSYSERYESARGGRETSRGSQEGWHFGGGSRSSRRDRDREKDQDANASRGESQENVPSRHFRRENDTERDFGGSSRGTSRDNNASRRRDEEGRSRRGGEGTGSSREERGGRFREHSRHHYERDWRDDKDRGRDRDREGYSRTRLDRARGTSKDGRDRRYD
ncbi:negative elongation factor e [Cystoisospora suis]|uniref:Negative elongation factor e n=1 Tax=Cystoisospora suis TaxID=483139 RepID=A0A2C6KQ47_9APIC|nr:negative elongation factor e [Cystoisospora suis]